MSPLPPPHHFQTPPPPTTVAQISFPSTPPSSSSTTTTNASNQSPPPQVLLVTLSRPRALNSIPSHGHWELHRLWDWFDAEPCLRVGIITGQGRAFCAGMDLKEWNDSNNTQTTSSSSTSASRSTSLSTPPSGFAGLSRRISLKPILAAVNGLAHGGGCEMVANCTLVLASPNARFALPEAKRGVVAMAGALPRLARIVGRMRAMEMALTGRDVGAEEARNWGLVNAISEPEPEAEGQQKREGGGGVVALALRYAAAIAACSPDSIIVSKEGVESGWTGGGVEEATQRLLDGSWSRMERGENLKEGVRAFVEKRPPRWVASKL